MWKIRAYARPRYIFTYISVASSRPFNVKASLAVATRPINFATKSIDCELAPIASMLTDMEESTHFVLLHSRVGNYRVQGFPSSYNVCSSIALQSEFVFIRGLSGIFSLPFPDLFTKRSSHARHGLNTS